MRFLGRVLRKKMIENLALTRQMEGKRSRERKRILWMTSLAASKIIKNTNIIHMTSRKELEDSSNGTMMMTLMMHVSIIRNSKLLVRKNANKLIALK